MPTANPRLNVVVEKPLYRAVKRRAAQTGSTLSVAARDLIKAGLEIEEDLALAELAIEREKTARREDYIPAEQVWDK